MKHPMVPLSLTMIVAWLSLGGVGWQYARLAHEAGGNPPPNPGKVGAVDVAPLETPPPIAIEPKQPLNPSMEPHKPVLGPAEIIVSLLPPSDKRGRISYHPPIVNPVSPPHPPSRLSSEVNDEDWRAGTILIAFAITSLVNTDQAAVNDEAKLLEVKYGADLVGRRVLFLDRSKLRSKNEWLGTTRPVSDTFATDNAGFTEFANRIRLDFGEVDARRGDRSPTLRIVVWHSAEPPSTMATVKGTWLVWSGANLKTQQDNRASLERTFDGVIIHGRLLTNLTESINDVIKKSTDASKGR